VIGIDESFSFRFNIGTRSVSSGEIVLNEFSEPSFVETSGRDRSCDLLLEILFYKRRDSFDDSAKFVVAALLGARESLTDLTPDGVHREALPFNVLLLLLLLLRCLF
jgi:hypothetical protein